MVLKRIYSRTVTVMLKLWQGQLINNKLGNMIIKKLASSTEDFKIIDYLDLEETITKKEDMELENDFFIYI